MNNFFLLNHNAQRVSILNLYSKNNSSQKKSTKLIYPKANRGFDAYIDYCIKMNKLSNSLSKEKNLIITPFNLESFLFGKSLKYINNNSLDNPRYWMQQNLAKTYLK